MVIIIIIFIIYKAQYPNMLKALYNKIYSYLNNNNNNFHHLVSLSYGYLHNLMFLSALFKLSICSNINSNDF